MEATLIKQKRKRMKIWDVIEISLGGTISALLIYSKKIYVSIVGATFINPDVKDFISDVTPILGFMTGLATLILLIYKIQTARKDLKKK